MDRNITIRRIDLITEGGCNGCGARPPTLWSVRFDRRIGQSMVIRLCDDCVKELKQALRKVR